MLRCIMSITNEGRFERGTLADGRWYSIDNITLKMSDGKRLKRYAVCVNGRWNSNQTMTLREARAEVQRFKDEAEQAKYYAMGI
ncbi:MAG: hypothetical protein IKE23_11450 [Exiguobacterium sp.]|nr:hypothetical protein [Exiguobacterium sp.]